MAESVLTPGAERVTFALLLDDAPVPEGLEVVAIQVERALGQLPRAVLTLASDLTVATVVDRTAGRVAPGTAVEVRLGWDGDDATVFRGIVLGQSVRLAGGRAELVLRCGDLAARLARMAAPAVAHGATDANVLAALFAAADLDADLADAPWSARPSPAPTAWDDLGWRAALHGLVVDVDDGHVRVQAPRADPPTLVATLGESIVRLALELAADEQVAGVRAHGTDSATDDAHTATAEEPELGVQGDLGGRQLAATLDVALDLHLGEVSEGSTPLVEELAARADAQLRWSRLARIRGTVAFPGNAAVLPDQLLEIAGVGARFDGDAWVSGVGHVVRDGTWETEVTIGLPYDVGAVAARFAPAPEIAQPTRVRLETAGGNVLTLDDADEAGITLADSSGNRVSLTPAGLLLVTPSGLTATAVGELVLEGRATVRVVSSGGDVVVEGQNVTAAANAEVQVTGGATAELSAGGTTTVNGAIVLIN